MAAERGGWGLTSQKPSVKQKVNSKWHGGLNSQSGRSWQISSYKGTSHKPPQTAPPNGEQVSNGRDCEGGFSFKPLQAPTRVCSHTRIHMHINKIKYILTKNSKPPFFWDTVSLLSWSFHSPCRTGIVKPTKPVQTVLKSKELEGHFMALLRYVGDNDPCVTCSVYAFANVQGASVLISELRSIILFLTSNPGPEN